MAGTRILALVGLALLTGGCYHATVETGAKPSTVTVEKRWAASWIGGLVPPRTIETAQKCTTGVAKVETQLGFVNMLVGFLTAGIYTPMDIRVTCAEGAAAMSLQIPADADPARWEAVLAEAAAQSVARERPTYVELMK